MPDKFEPALHDKLEIAAATTMFDRWIGQDQSEDRDNSPHAVMSRIMDMELDIETPIHDGKATVMEVIMLKTAEQAMLGNLSATSMIIKEIQHGGVEKHAYMDGIPDDVKYLFQDVDFTTIDGEATEIAADEPTAVGGGTQAAGSLLVADDPYTGVREAIQAVEDTGIIDGLAAKAEKADEDKAFINEWL